MICHSCKKEIPVVDLIGRRDECPYCHADLHVCLNCQFYDPAVYNECREANAERVLEKDRSNYCDYFSAMPMSSTAEGTHPTDEARRQLESLFKKN
jgi:hypothetical protein